MRFASIVRHRLRSLFSRPAVERELDEEMRYHLEREIDANLAAGMSRADAQSAAFRAITGFTQRKEECRDMRGLNFIDNLLRDSRYALRQLRRNPGFTFTAVFVLALGMCASISIFAFVDAALIQPLPYRDPARLLGVFEGDARCGYCNISYPNFLDWKERNVVFSSFAAYRSRTANLDSPGGPQPLRGARVSNEFLRTLGVTPMMGRDFTPADNLPSAPHTVILSYASWKQRYAGRNDILGQSLTINGDPYTIIGVLPREFHFALVGQAEFWMAYQPTTDCGVRRNCRDLYGVARLKDGVSTQAAQANVAAIAVQLQKEYPDADNGQGGAVTPLTNWIVGYIRPILLVLLGGAGLLLLIASVNVAGLQLVRSESRAREIAVRTALGASFGRLISQFVTEAMVLAAAGSVLGVISAQWTITLLQKLISPGMIAYLPFLSGLGVNGHVLAAAGAIAVVSAAVLSFPPAGRIWSSNTHARLAEASRGSAGMTWRRLGSKLVVLELATAMILLAGAGLLGKSLYLLLRVSLGLNPDHLVTTDIWLPLNLYKTGDQTVAVTREIQRAIEALPGVRSVGFEDGGLPLGDNAGDTWFRVVGRPWHGEHETAPERDISPNYFLTLGAKLVNGRYFSESEDSSKPHVAIVNQAFVRKYFPGEDPIGKQLSDLQPTPTAMEIVGVVEDIREGPLDAPIPPVIYIPFAQGPSAYFSVVARTFRDERSFLPAMWAAIRQVNREIVPVRGAPMADRLNNSDSTFLHRSLAWLVGGFAALALLLGVVGLYGVIAYSVSRRSREIGIRMALGAQTGSVYRLILKEAGWLTGIGIAIGLTGSIPAAALMRDQLFGVQSWDVAMLAAVAVILGVAALLASFIPARRAASVNPVEALRSE